MIQIKRAPGTGTTIAESPRSLTASPGVCGPRDGIASIGQFCIDTRLAFALRGDVKKGLFFRGSESVPFGAAIRPVTELIRYFLTGARPKLQE